MKKLLIGGTIALSVFLPVSFALADPPVGGPPGQGACDVGNSDNTCVPDPQPDNGKDCEEHGPFEGGVNENHCLTTTTTVTIPPTTTTTVPPPSDTTTTTVPHVTSTTTAPATTTSAPGLTHTKPPTPPTTGGGSQHKAPLNPADKPLAFTGVEDIVPIAALALGLLLIGSWIMWVARKR